MTRTRIAKDSGCPFEGDACRLAAGSARDVQLRRRRGLTVKDVTRIRRLLHPLRTQLFLPLPLSLSLSLSRLSLSLPSPVHRSICAALSSFKSHNPKLGRVQLKSSSCFLGNFQKIPRGSLEMYFRTVWRMPLGVWMINGSKSSSSKVLYIDTFVIRNYLNPLLKARF